MGEQIRRRRGARLHPSHLSLPQDAKHRLGAIPVCAASRQYSEIYLTYDEAFAGVSEGVIIVDADLGEGLRGDEGGMSYLRIMCQWVRSTPATPGQTAEDGRRLTVSGPWRRGMPHYYCRNEA